MSILPHFIKASSASDDNAISSLRTDSGLIDSAVDSPVLVNSTSALFRPQNAPHFVASRQYASPVIDERVNIQTSSTPPSTSTPVTLPLVPGAGPQGSTSPAQGASPPAAHSVIPSVEYSTRKSGVTVRGIGNTSTGRTNNPHFIEDILGRQKHNMDHNTG